MLEGQTLTQDWSNIQRDKLNVINTMGMDTLMQLIRSDEQSESFYKMFNVSSKQIDCSDFFKGNHSCLRLWKSVSPNVIE